MDNDEELSKESQTKTISDTTNVDDDDSSSMTVSTTSTETELLDTWTVVAAEKIKDTTQNNNTNNDTNDIEEAIDALNKRVNDIKDDTKLYKDAKDEIDEHIEDVDDHHPTAIKTTDLKTEHDCSVDDLSDGISIISECESSGRISPHPNLREHLQDMAMTYSQPPDFFTKILSEEDEMIRSSSTIANELRQKKRKRSTSCESVNRTKQQHHQQQLQAQMMDGDDDDTIVETTTVTMIRPCILKNFVRHGLSGIFYVGIAIGLLAMYGRWRHADWDEYSAATQPMSELQQKVIDMELQNNLMRAEIDILSKQVNYLSNRNEQKTFNQHQQQQQPPPQQQQQTHQQQQTYQRKDQHKDKTFKAWPGNGENLEPMKINKDDLKRPFKCEDGRFVEIAGMCVEQSADTVGNIIDAIRQADDTLDAHKNDAKEKPANPVIVDTLAFMNDMRQEYLKGKENFNPNANGRGNGVDGVGHDTHNSKERFNNKEYRASSKERFKDKRFKDNSKEELYKDNSNEKRYRDNNNNNNKNNNRKQRVKDDSKENEQQQYNKENRSKDNSKEQYQHHKENKERHHKKNYDNSNEHKHRDNSRERYNGRMEFHHRSPKGSAESKGNGSGEWHDKLMKQREQLRRQQDKQKQDKNWYIERGEDREHLRYN